MNVAHLAGHGGSANIVLVGSLLDYNNGAVLCTIQTIWDDFSEPHIDRIPDNLRLHLHRLVWVIDNYTVCALSCTDTTYGCSKLPTSLVISKLDLCELFVRYLESIAP